MISRCSGVIKKLAAAGVVLATLLTGVTVAASPAAAVSGWSGKDPFHDYGGGACGVQTSDNKVVRLLSTETYVYDGSMRVGVGYLAYSPKCQTNWAEFYYDTGNPAAYNTHTVEPSAWEQGKTGTDQYSSNLDDYGPVYSRMVDGRGPACAGAQLYTYPGHHHITWWMFGCV